MDKIAATFSDYDINNILNKDFDGILLQHSVHIELNDNLISLTIMQIELSKYKIENIFDGLMSLFFIALGRHLTLISYSKNDNNVDINRFTDQINTSINYQKRYFKFCDINNNLLTESNLKKIIDFKLKNASLNSLEYLICKNYNSVLWEHKFVLLLHVLDGVTEHFNLNSNTLKKEFKCDFAKDLSDNNQPGEYICKLNYIFSKYYFKYDIISSKTIKLLKRKNKYSFLQGIEQSRNWYSHLPDKNKCSSRIDTTNTDNLAILFIIICVARLLLLENYLNIQPDDKCVKESFACIHDWILDTSEKKYKFENLLSDTYKLYFALKS